MIPDNARPPRITAAAGTKLAGAFFRGTVNVPWYFHGTLSSPGTDLYTPRSFIGHAALLRQAFAHCAKFPTAASRRSLGRISVPVWLIILSNQLLIVALVSRYPTNKLIRRRPISQCDPDYSGLLSSRSSRFGSVSGISPGFPGLFQAVRQVVYALLTRSPVYFPAEAGVLLDLHVLSTPPAFVLSQDQTLRCMFFNLPTSLVRP